MKRLTHSDQGFIRSLQISRVQLFLFVEGGLDRPFGDRLVNLAFPIKPWEHQIIAMKECPNRTGGKPALLALFKTLRKQKMLNYTAFGKKKVSLFIADKDIDDLTRSKVRSNHFLYTTTYDLEGHLFSSGNLIKAIADACLVTPHQASKIIGDQATWIKRNVVNWKEWTSLCVISQKNKVNVGCGFTRVSAINQDHLHPADHDALKRYALSLQTALGISSAQFWKLYDKVAFRIQRSVDSNDPLRYFKGKWLGLILEKHLQAAPPIPDANFSGSGERVMSTLVAQVGHKNPCRSCSPFIEDIQRVASALH